jgi:CDP-diacylglycerol--inositol 3-phosphatidyltransferase
MNRQELLHILNADNAILDGNINEKGCQMRSNSSVTLLVVALALTVTGKCVSYCTSKHLTSRFFPWYPISLVYTASVASYLESVMKTCLIVTTLNIQSNQPNQSSSIIKSCVILLCSIVVHILSFVLLGQNDRGTWFPSYFLKLLNYVGIRFDSIWFYIPNIIGYVRLFLLLISLFFVHTIPTLFIMLWCVSVSLDFFDGYFARRLNQCSQFGVLLDVLCDNITRTTMWFAASCKNQNLLHLSIIVITVEWTTFVCTQLDSTEQNNHWKNINQHKKVDDHIHPLVQYFFSNNFINPIGIVGIGGLFGLPLQLYAYSAVCNTKSLNTQFQIWFDCFSYMLYVGRFICACIEIYFIGRYFKKIVHREQLMMKNK